MAMDRLFALLCVIGMGMGAFAPAGEVKLGISLRDANQYNMEFVQFDESAKFYNGNGIQAVLIEQRLFMDVNHISRLANELKKFHAVVVRNDGERLARLTPELRANAEKVGKILEEYVRGGGGLIIQFRPTRYPNDEEHQYWNLVFEAFGVEQLKEGVSDPASLVDAEMKTGAKMQFFYTSAFEPHDVTKGVRGLWLPTFSFNRFPGVPLFRYSSDWTVAVRGEPTAKSFRVDAGNILQLNRPGTVDSAPPIVAVREFGKGRVVSVAVDKIFTGMNLNVPSWSQRVEKGTDEQPSDVMTLMANAAMWAAAPALKVATLGSYGLPTYKPVEFPASFVVNPNFVADKKNQAKGVIGLRSNFTEGKSSIAEYVVAAKAAGLSFIAFIDPLEQLTKEKLDDFKKACLEASSDDFYVCPGVEFTDGAGLRWIFLGEKIIWPNPEPFRRGAPGVDYTRWDGKAIQHYGGYSQESTFPPSALVSYQNLRDNKVRPENLWWFFNVIPYSYAGDKLIADNYADWKFGLADLRYLVPLAYTRITSAAEIPLAAKTSMQVISNAKSAQAMLNQRVNQLRIATPERAFVTYGGSVMIENFTAVNAIIDPRALRTRGVQRVPVRFAVSSGNGISEVKVLDADQGALRVFNGGGAKSFAKEFELAMDKQHSIFLEVTDAGGNKAISNYLFLYDYKQGFYRCGDNLNTLGPLGIILHPDRQEMLPLVKDFRNAELYSVHGWDRGSPDVPYPSGRLQNLVWIAGKGDYPQNSGGAMPAMRMRVQMAGGDMLIVDAVMDEIAERFNTERRPTPAWASPPRILGENEYFAHTQRMYFLRDRMDMHIGWDHRRLRESLENYEGAASYFEGKITFKQDVALDNRPGAAQLLSIVLHLSQATSAVSPVDDLVIVKDAAQGLVLSEMKVGAKTNLSGMVAKDGFAALSNSPIGYIGIVPLKGDWGYNYGNGGLRMGIGRPGQTIKAGETLEYAFISLNLLDKERDGTRLEMLRRVYAEGDYPLVIEAGERGAIEECFLNIKAADHEAAFTFGPKSVGIDFPVRVDGVVDNGCAAVYSTVRPWFRYIGVMDGSESAFFQEPMDKENRIWAGNVFVSDNADLRFTLVVDGQPEGAAPFLEVHNPTAAPVKAMIRSPKNTPVFGGMSFELAIPTGDSLFYNLKDKKATDVIPAKAK